LPANEGFLLRPGYALWVRQHGDTVFAAQGKNNMATVQKNPAGSDYVMQIRYPQGEYGTEGGAQFYQRLKSMCRSALWPVDACDV
jgi:hypothetical protein